MVFKLVPQLNGAFAAFYADKMIGLNYKPADGTGETGIDFIIPVNSSTGESAVATMKDFQRLAQNLHVPGLIMCTSKRDIRALKIPKQKLAHKVINETCLSSGVIQLRDKGAVFATITQSGFIKLHTLPSLSDAGDIKIPSLIFSARQACVNNGAGYKSCILGSGDIFSWLGPTEIMNLVLYDETKNKFKEKPTDSLFNETTIIPPRPTPSALLWAKGQTAYVSSKDLAFLIAGANRKPSKDCESELAYNISPEANVNHAYGTYGGTSTKTSHSAYAEPVRKGVKSNQYNFGTQGFMKSLRDGLDTMEEKVNHYANGISESVTNTVESQKKSMYSAALKSKLGL